MSRGRPEADRGEQQAAIQLIEAEDAVRVATESARSLGLTVEDAEVIRDQHHVLVHLRPNLVLARVAPVATAPRDTHAHMQNEIGVARFLVDRGGPVVPPATDIDSGPHVVGRAVVSYWRYVEHRPPSDPARAGRALARCHALTRGADLHLESPGGNPAREALGIFARLLERGVVHSARGRRLANRAREDVDAMGELGLREQIIHGDAHLENLLTDDGEPLWNDWEDTFRGPLQWDIACLVATAVVTGAGRSRTESALRGYGVDRIDPVVEFFVRIRAFQVATWILATAAALGSNTDQAEPWLTYSERHARRRLVPARLRRRKRRAWPG